MNARTHALFAAALLFTGSCVHVEDQPTYDPYTYEAEPNDFYYGAQGIGPICVGESFLIRGHIDDFGNDPFDGFAFRSDVPMDIEFALYADEPFDDFDVELFDPYTLQTVARWETGANPEAGRFSVVSSGFEFHLVVSSFHGSGSYTLEVRGAPLTWYGIGATQLAAQGISERAERSVDWTGYAQRGTDGDADEVPAWVLMTTYEIDPTTGHTRRIDVRRLPRQAAAFDRD